MCACTFYVPPFLPPDFKEQAASSQSCARPIQEALLKQVRCECTGPSLIFDLFPRPAGLRHRSQIMEGSLFRPFSYGVICSLGAQIPVFIE
jgi:hypothetical protein